MSRYVAVVYADPESEGFVSYIPGVPGVAEQGDTEEEAYENIRKALAFHLECMIEEGMEFPEGAL